MIVQLKDALADTCGGKAAALGTLLRAGLPVPDGFVVPFSVYRAADPGALLGAITDGLRTLGDPPVAVRSSASGEDTAGASAAGQHESVLAVRGADDVAAATRTCWASLHAPRAVDYRAALGQTSSCARPTEPAQPTQPAEPAMAVLVQRLVDADVSGVLFTPATPDGATEIEASWGLGPSIVGGTVTPDAYRVTGDGTVTSTPAHKQTRLDRDGVRLVERAVPPLDRDRQVLDAPTITRLTRLGQEVADVLGGPQDIEWALAGDRLWILQARPITAALPARPAASLRPVAPVAPVAPARPPTLTGRPGSHGTATGIARIVRGPADFARVQPGDILVCPTTDPAWTPLLRLAAGVVTETGGALSHAAIVARELRIPAVLGVHDAVGRISDGTTLAVDGSAGTITLQDR